jgi:CubicO group peptidase (beta-lactamase class C family)
MLTRRSLLLGASAGLATSTSWPLGAHAEGARAEGAIMVWQGKSAAEHARLREDAARNGYRALSLSIYGPPAAPLFAAVMIKRPAGVEQRELSSLTAAQLSQALDEQGHEGFGPTIIGATGTAADARFAVVLEPQNPLPRTMIALRPGNAADPATFQGANQRAKIDGLVPAWMATYGSAAEPCVAAIWKPNLAKTIWNADGVLNTDQELSERINAEALAWRRPALLAVDAEGRNLSVFVDSQVGGWQARHGMNEAAFRRETDAFVQKGYVPISVQAAGRAGAGARFSAVFAERETPLEKTFTARGPVANQAIDDVFMKFMAAQPLRQASVAIVKGTRLVYARGYTYAEAGWPLAEPTTLFRLASVSKNVTALAVFQAIEEGKLKLTDRMQDILALATPRGAPPTDPRFRDITLGHLLEHTSGLNTNSFRNNIAVLEACRAGRPGVSFGLPVTAAMIDAYIASLKLDDNPGEKQVYNNCGAYMLGRVLARVRRAATPIEAMQRHLFAPLAITRIRRARTLVGDQLPDEARYGATASGTGADVRLDLGLARSVMSNDRPLVPRGYGEEQYEDFEGAGGLSAAATDLARLIAVWISPRDTPALKRETVKSMLSNAVACGAKFKTRAGYGLDGAAARGGENYYGQKGGDLSTSQNVLQFNGEWGFAVNWASHLTDIGVRWYPNFPEMMGIAMKVDWGTTDLFPQFGMPTLG